MSATVLPFTGQWQGRIEPTPYQGKAQAAGIHDARLILAAKRENDDWTARLLLALLETLDHKQLRLLEFRMLGPRSLDCQSALQALAIVQLANGTNAHRGHVRNALEALLKTEAGQ